jgi:hypothetical protein
MADGSRSSSNSSSSSTSEPFKPAPGDSPFPATALLPLRFDVVSKVGCVWCDRLKDSLEEMGELKVVVDSYTTLDPASTTYPEQREAVLARAGHRQVTFPFVFDAATGSLIGGYEATMRYIRLAVEMDDEEDVEF